MLSIIIIFVYFRCVGEKIKNYNFHRHIVFEIFHLILNIDYYLHKSFGCTQSLYILLHPQIQSPSAKLLLTSIYYLLFKIALFTKICHIGLHLRMSIVYHDITEETWTAQTLNMLVIILTKLSYWCTAAAPILWPYIAQGEQNGPKAGLKAP